MLRQRHRGGGGQQLLRIAPIDDENERLAGGFDQLDGGADGARVVAIGQGRDDDQIGKRNDALEVRVGRRRRIDEGMEFASSRSFARISGSVSVVADVSGGPRSPRAALQAVSAASGVASINAMVPAAARSAWTAMLQTSVVLPDFGHADTNATTRIAQAPRRD